MINWNFYIVLRQKKNEDRSFLYEALNFGNKKTGFDSISYNNVSLENDSLTINFKSNTRDYSRIIDNKTYLSLNLDFNLKSEMIKNEKKNFDKKINYKYEKNFISTFEIPENFAIESIPESTKFNNESFGFFVSYELSDDKKTVTLRKNITINSLKIETQEVEDWNGFIKSLNKTNRQAIVLIEI